MAERARREGTDEELAVGEPERAETARLDVDVPPEGKPPLSTDHVAILKVGGTAEGEETHARQIDGGLRRQIVIDGDASAAAAAAVVDAGTAVGAHPARTEDPRTGNPDRAAGAANVVVQSRNLLLHRPVHVHGSVNADVARRHDAHHAAAAPRVPVVRLVRAAARLGRLGDGIVGGTAAFGEIGAEAIFKPAARAAMTAAGAIKASARRATAIGAALSRIFIRVAFALARAGIAASASVHDARFRQSERAAFHPHAGGRNPFARGIRRQHLVRRVDEPSGDGDRTRRANRRIPAGDVEFAALLDRQGSQLCRRRDVRDGRSGGDRHGLAENRYARRFPRVRLAPAAAFHAPLRNRRRQRRELLDLAADDPQPVARDDVPLIGHARRQAGDRLVLSLTGREEAEGRLDRRAVLLAQFDPAPRERARAQFPDELRRRRCHARAVGGSQRRNAPRLERLRLAPGLAARVLRVNAEEVGRLGRQVRDGRRLLARRRRRRQGLRAVPRRSVRPAVHDAIVKRQLRRIAAIAERNEVCRDGRARTVDDVCGHLAENRISEARPVVMAEKRPVARIEEKLVVVAVRAVLAVAIVAEALGRRPVQARDRPGAAAAVAEAERHVMPALRHRNVARRRPLVPERVLEDDLSVDLHPRAVVHVLAEMVDALLKVHLAPVDVGDVLRPEGIGAPVLRLFRRVQAESRVRFGGPVRPVRLARHRADLEAGLPLGAQGERAQAAETDQNRHATDSR